jgi:glycosyltransferase involved in cell wall biosynthesis
VSAACDRPTARVARVGASITLNTVLRRQMTLLREQGFEVVAVCDADEWAAEIRADGIQVWALGMGTRPTPLALLRWGVRLYLLLRRTAVDVVHFHNAFHSLIGPVAARVAGVPHVVRTVHAWYYLDEGGALRAGFYRRLERLAARCVDATLFLNREDFTRAIDDRIVEPSKRHLIGNGIDVAAFSALVAEADPVKVRRELGLESESFVVTMVARLARPKDQGQVLEVLPSIVRRHPHVRLLLAGVGPSESELRARVEALGLSDIVYFLGHRDDVPNVLSGSDASILISSREGFGRCLVESMVARVPIVASDVAGIRDVVDHERTGLLVPFGDRRALEAAVLRIIESPEVRARLTRAAYRDAIERFDESRAADRVGTIYRSLLAAPASDYTQESAGQHPRVSVSDASR